jgi:negative regulator of flagellin synthesis FlgM
MKVSNNLPNSVQSAEAAKTGKAGGPESLLDSAKAKKGSAIIGNEISASARVDVSQRAQDIKKAKELATPSDSIDEAKVARLQALIDSGKYKVDAEAIADRLLDEHSKMPL